MGAVNNVPCVICGDFTGDEDGVGLKDILVKKEVTVTAEDSEEGGGDEFSGILSSLDSDSAQQGVNSVQELEGEGGEGGGSSSLRWTQEEQLIYEWFVKCFHLPLTVQRRQVDKRRTKVGWDGNSGRDPFPICGPCKGYLGELLRHQQVVEELQEKIKVGVKLLKERATGCEEAFGKSGIYERDGRYKRARQFLVKDFNLLNANKKKPSEDTRTPKVGRSSARKRTDVSKVGVSAEALPVVLLSTSDRETADIHLQNVIIKPETETNEGDLDILDKLIAEAEAEPEDVPSPLEPFGDSEPEPEDQPVRKRSSRKRKRVLPNTGEIAGPELDNFFEDDPHDMEELPPPPPRPGSKPKKKRKPRDADWIAEEDKKSEPEDVFSSDEEPDDDPQKSRTVLDLAKKTLTYKHLTFHLLEPLADHKVQCSECHLVVNHSRTRIQYHYVRYHSRKYACRLCDFRGGGKMKLRLHMASNHNGPPVPQQALRRVDCPICGRPTPKMHLKLHLWSHYSKTERQLAIASNSPDVPSQKLPKYQCDECGHNFQTTYNLKNHLKTVHSKAREKQLELCSLCGGSFLALKAHMHFKHEIGLKTYQCLEPGCGKSFKGLTYLARHKSSVHLKERPFKCTLCPREFTLQKNLDLHLNTHLGVRPWKCDHCPSGFSRKSHLERHVKTYHEEGCQPRRKPYQRGASMLPPDVKKSDLVKEGKYLPPSALATWAAGREPTSHFPRDLKLAGLATGQGDNSS